MSGPGGPQGGWFRKHFSPSRMSSFFSFRALSSLLAAAAALFLVSCAGNGLKVLPKNSIQLGNSEEFARATVPASALAGTANKPKDRHNMPVYSFQERRRIVRTTAYTCTECDHLIYGNKNAVGTPLRYTNRVRSAAADWSFYPVGTTFRISGMPYLYVVDDYGSALAGTATVDLYKPSKAVMNQWGRRNVEITVVRWGSFERSATVLSQRTHHTHCRRMLANIIRQRPDLGHLARR